MTAAFILPVVTTEKGTLPLPVFFCFVFVQQMIPAIIGFYRHSVNSGVCELWCRVCMNFLGVTMVQSSECCEYHCVYMVTDNSKVPVVFSPCRRDIEQLLGVTSNTKPFT